MIFFSSCRDAIQTHLSTICDMSSKGKRVINHTKTHVTCIKNFFSLSIVLAYRLLQILSNCVVSFIAQCLWERKKKNKERERVARDMFLATFFLHFFWRVAHFMSHCSSLIIYLYYIELILSQNEKKNEKKWRVNIIVEYLTVHCRGCMSRLLWRGFFFSIGYRVSRPSKLVNEKRTVN